MYDDTTIQRFWAKVAVPEDRNPDVCWEWQGALTGYGYGALYKKRKLIATHRMSYIIHFGEIQDGLFVCHSCDNRKCVNPNHLWLGTAGDNNRDYWQKRNAKRDKDDGN